MGALTNIINRITMVLNVAGTLLIVALMVLICADVIARSALSMPISGVPELVSLSIVAIVFLQAPEAFRMGRFTRSEAMLNFLERRSIRLSAGLEFLFALLALGIIAVLLRASFPFFIKSWNRETFIGTVGDFIAPVWPVKLIILVGCTALIAQIGLYAIRQFSIVFGSDTNSSNSGKAAL
jgi:TRAP-type mannitol/chloroaromatic compound transport system permease small subunit